MFFKRLSLSIILLFFLPASTFAEEGRWEEPWSGEALPASSGEYRSRQSRSLAKKVGEGFFLFFQKYISPVDGDRCPSYPTCSQYGAEAVRKHGVIMGFVMTFGRLIHETDEIHRAPLIRLQDSYRYYDPVENNDFWWSKDRNR